MRLQEEANASAQLNTLHQVDQDPPVDHTVFVVIPVVDAMEVKTIFLQIATMSCC